MAKSPVLWSLLSLASIVLVSSGQYQKIPENYLKQAGTDSQLVTIQFLIYRPCNQQGQAEGQLQDEGLCPVMTSPCSLLINTTMTELFFTNKTNEDSNDSDDFDDYNSYWTLLDFSAINNTLKILPISKFIPDIILKGAFIFDLQCMTPEDLQCMTPEDQQCITPEAEILPTATPTLTPSANVNSSDYVLEEKWWYMIVGVLASLCVLIPIAQYLIYKQSRKERRVRIPPLPPANCVRYESDMAVPSTYCRPTKSRKSDKEYWQITPQNENDIEGHKFQSAEHINKKEKRISWRQKFKSKNNRAGKKGNEYSQTGNQGAGKKALPTSAKGHDPSVPIETYEEYYLPMNNHPKKTKETIDDEYLPMDIHPKKLVPVNGCDPSVPMETFDDEYLPMDIHPKKLVPVNGCDPSFPMETFDDEYLPMDIHPKKLVPVNGCDLPLPVVLPPLPMKTKDHDYLNMANHPKKSKY